MKESRWDLLIRAVPHGAASESAFAHRTGKGEVTDDQYHFLITIFDMKLTTTFFD